jgi:putative effector of murein hydrolase LrgA (UPF0299 family)
MSNLVQSVVIAGFLALGNILTAILAFRIALRQTQTQKFLDVIIGSMAARLAVMLGIVWYGLKILHLHSIAFPITLLGLYMVSMTLEITIIHKRELRLQRQRAANMSATNTSTYNT